jgi:hypothetical protein
MPLDQVRIVLVRPEEPGNVGAAARAMKNFGLRHLVLVDPRLERPEKAYSFAHGAEEILEGADVELTSRERLTSGLTAPSWKHRGGPSLGRAAETASSAGRWRVFGRNHGALRRRGCTLLDRVLIPTARAPIAQLGPSGGGVRHELYLAHQSEPRVQAATAAMAKRDALRHLRTALPAVDFLNPRTPARMGQCGGSPGPGRRRGRFVSTRGWLVRSSGRDRDFPSERARSRGVRPPGAREGARTPVPDSGAGPAGGTGG